MNWTLILVAVLLALVAGVLASLEAAISSFSKARADELAGEGKGGAARLARILEDPAPYINSNLLMRLLAETTSIVLVALVVAARIDGDWQQVVVAVAIMVVVSFVLIGVGPARLGASIPNGSPCLRRRR